VAVSSQRAAPVSQDRYRWAAIRGQAEPERQQAPIGQKITSLSKGEVAISERTDVVGSDGHELGRVDEMLIDDENRIVGFVVKAGFVFKHDIRIPIAWVAGIAQDQIRLSETKDEAATGGMTATA
jgi:hypothetical protein